MKPLVINPHPDDAEYSLSGTILKHQEIEWTILGLSAGGDNDVTTGVKRIAESAEFWNCFDNVTYIKINSFASIFETPEWKMVEMVERFTENIDTIFVTPNDDTHLEHRKMNDVARASIRGKPINLIEYCTPSTYHTWTPNFFVDVEHQYKQKIELLKKFESQLDKFYFTENNISIFHEDYFCRLRGLNKVEKFKLNHLFM